MAALRSTQDGKAPGGDGIPAEVWKFGGAQLITAYASSSKRYNKPKKYLKTGRMQVSCLCSRKGDRKNCGSYRGILLLASVGKILARVLLNRLNEHISDFLLETSSRKVYRIEPAAICSLH